MDTMIENFTIKSETVIDEHAKIVSVGDQDNFYKHGKGNGVEGYQVDYVVDVYGIEYKICTKNKNKSYGGYGMHYVADDNYKLLYVKLSENEEYELLNDIIYTLCAYAESKCEYWFKQNT